MINSISIKEAIVQRDLNYFETKGNDIALFFVENPEELDKTLLLLMTQSCFSSASADPLIRILFAINEFNNLDESRIIYQAAKQISSIRAQNTKLFLAMLACNIPWYEANDNDGSYYTYASNFSAEGRLHKKIHELLFKNKIQLQTTKHIMGELLFIAASENAQDSLNKILSFARPDSNVFLSPTPRVQPEPVSGARPSVSIKGFAGTNWDTASEQTPTNDSSVSAMLQKDLVRGLTAQMFDKPEDPTLPPMPIVKSKEVLEQERKQMEEHQKYRNEVDAIAQLGSPFVTLYYVDAEGNSMLSGLVANNDLATLKSLCDKYPELNSDQKIGQALLETANKQEMADFIRTFYKLPEPAKEAAPVLTFKYEKPEMRENFRVKKLLEYLKSKNQKYFTKYYGTIPIMDREDVLAALDEVVTEKHKDLSDAMHGYIGAMLEQGDSEKVSGKKRSADEISNEEKTDANSAQAEDKTLNQHKDKKIRMYG